jgi:hypothetical protein
MGLPEFLVIALTDDLVPMHNHTANHRIGGYMTKPFNGEIKAALHEGFVRGHERKSINSKFGILSKNTFRPSDQVPGTRKISTNPADREIQMQRKTKKQDMKCEEYHDYWYLRKLYFSAVHLRASVRNCIFPNVI